jgi:hypothetical protein
MACDTADLPVTARRTPALRSLLTAFALANLIWFPQWQAGLHYSNEYYYDVPSAGRPVLAATFTVLLLTALLWGAALAVERWGSRTVRVLARCAFLGLLLIPLNHVRTNLDGSGALIETAGKAAVILIAALVVLGLYWTLRGSRRPSLAAQLAVMIFLPYGLLTFGQAAWVLAGGRDALYRQGPLAAAIAASHAPDRPRVLWLIFDELDQELTFETRPSDVKLPALDDLRNESLWVERAYAPGGWTIVSLPALLTGRLVERAEPASASELWLKFLDQPEAERWGTQPSVFSRARQRQLNTALVGNYHPYCRILSDLVSCYSVSYREGVPERCGSVACESVRQVIGLVYHLPLMDRVPWVRLRYEAMNAPVPWDESKAGIARFKAIHQRVLQLATDPATDLIFVHYPVPHGPIIFDRATDDFLRAGKTADRFDNMVLADHALAELRMAMERAGVWERTAVVVSADHGEKDIAKLAFDAQGNRIERRVPFILKLPFRSAAVRYDREMNTVITQDLVLALLDGAVSDDEELVAWLDEHATFGKSPAFPGNEN